MGTWRYCVLGMVVGDSDGGLSRRVRTVVAQDGDSMWHTVSRQGRLGVMEKEDGHEGHQSMSDRPGQGRARLALHPDYTTRRWYGITAAAAALLLDSWKSTAGLRWHTLAGWKAGWRW